MTCPICGQPMPTLNADGHPRKVCSSGPCLAAWGRRTPTRRDIHAENVEELLSWGESPDAIAARIGIEVRSLGRALARAGRHDLARQGFNRRTA